MTHLTDLSEPSLLLTLRVRFESKLIYVPFPLSSFPFPLSPFLFPLSSFLFPLSSVLLTLSFPLLSSPLKTYVGSILIVVNPYQSLPLYNAPTLALYQLSRISSLAPHIYAIANEVHYLLSKTFKDQAILIRSFPSPIGPPFPPFAFRLSPSPFLLPS